MREDPSNHVDSDEDRAQPEPAKPEEPILDYQSPAFEVAGVWPARRTVPRAVGAGFTVTALVLTVSWIALAETMISHIALYLSGAMTVAALVLITKRRSRLVGLGCILAVGIWLLMLGLCSQTGTVSPYAF